MFGRNTHEQARILTAQCANWSRFCAEQAYMIDFILTYGRSAPLSHEQNMKLRRQLFGLERRVADLRCEVDVLHVDARVTLGEDVYSPSEVVPQRRDYADALRRLAVVQDTYIHLLLKWKYVEDYPDVAMVPPVMDVPLTTTSHIPSLDEYQGWVRVQKVKNLPSVRRATRHEVTPEGATMLLHFIAINEGLGRNGYADYKKFVRKYAKEWIE